MASPVLSERTYRLSQIPAGTTREGIQKLFASSLLSLPPPNTEIAIQAISLAEDLTDNSTSSSVKKVATITFTSEPPALVSVLPGMPGCLLSTLIPDLDNGIVTSSEMWIDAHFHGFTPLNDPSNEEEYVIEMFALTGLGGKPFASWQCYDGSMWLRDHVPLDVAQCRMILYGYSSEVGSSTSTSTLSEIAEAFVLELANYRRISQMKSNHHKKNLTILMGHSTGGLIIKDAWCRVLQSRDLLHREVHQSIIGLVFFGTPHNGMYVDNILSSLKDQPAEQLIRDISPGSTYIKSLKERFSIATETTLENPLRRVISCYELRETPQSKVLPNGTIVRTGKAAMNAPESSACLYWAKEIRIPINENHSMIAKLAAKRQGSAYGVVVGSLSSLAADGRSWKHAMDMPSCLGDRGCIGATCTQTTGSAMPTQSSARPTIPTVAQQDSNSLMTPISSTHTLSESPTLLSPPRGYDLMSPPADRPIRIYVFGSWYPFDHGFLRLAKQAFSKTRLIVGVCRNDSADGLASAGVTMTETAEVVQSCRYVDEVIEDSPTVIQPEFASRLRLDYVGCCENSLLLDAPVPDPHSYLKSQGRVFIVPEVHC